MYECVCGIYVICVLIDTYIYIYRYIDMSYDIFMIYSYIKHVYLQIDNRYVLTFLSASIF